MFSCVEPFGKSRGRETQLVPPAPDSFCSSELVKLEIIIINVKSWCWEGDGLGGLRECSIPGDTAQHTGMMCESVSVEELPLPQLFSRVLVYGSDSTSIFLWQFLHARGVMQQAWDALWCNYSSGAGAGWNTWFKFQTYCETDESSHLDCCRLLGLPLLSGQDLGFAPWLDDITTIPAQGCLVGFLVFFGFFFSLSAT